MGIDEKYLGEMIRLTACHPIDFIKLLKGMFRVLKESEIEKIKDCIFIDFRTEQKARFVNKCLLPLSVKHIIIIWQDLFEGFFMQGDLVKSIFHEFAHCTLGHSDGQPGKCHHDQETEAEELADKWFLEWQKSQV